MALKGMERTTLGITAGLAILAAAIQYLHPPDQGARRRVPLFIFGMRAREKGKEGILMAVVKTPQNSRIGIVIANGVSSTGAEQVKTLRFSNVKPTATDQDMYDVAVSLSGLMASALVEIVRTDEANLTSE